MKINNKRASGTRPVRQGDVLIVPVNNIPDGLKPINNQDTKCTLALGEATGHHHSFAPGGVLGFADPKSDQAVADFFEIETDVEELTHQEHGGIELPKGKYESVIQTEYVNKNPVRVRD